MVDVSWLLHACHNRCRRVDAQCHDLCIFALGVAACRSPMYTGHSRCCLADVIRPRLKSLSRCAHNTINVCMPWMMVYLVGRHPMPDAHISRSFIQVLVNVACHWPTSVSIYVLPCPCVQAMAEPTYIDRCRLQDEHMRKHMRASLGKCCILLSDICRPMCAGYRRYCQAISDVDKPICEGYKRC